MKAASLKEIRDELNTSSKDELIELCSRLIRFKKENKELLTYLLFKSFDEREFIEEVKMEMTNQFQEINKSSLYYVKKSARKILRYTKKHLRYTNEKESEIQLLIHYCQVLKDFKPSVMKDRAMVNLYNRQVDVIKKTLKGLHEDLQMDYEESIESLT